MPARKREHKWLKIGLFLVLIVAAVVVCYFVWDGYFNDQKKEVSTSQNQPENHQDDSVKQSTEAHETPTNSNTKAELEEGKKVSQYEGEDVAEAASLTGDITYVGESNGVVSIWVNIDQFVASGTCALKVLGNGGVMYEETVPLIADVTTSTCAGFSFARDRLSSSEGEIVIDLLSEDNKKGTLKGSLNL